MKLPLYLLVLWLLCGSVSMAQAASPQSADSLAALKSQALKVYLDCRRCDQDYFRTEIPFVSYVTTRPKPITIDPSIDGRERGEPTSEPDV